MRRLASAARTALFLLLASLVAVRPGAGASYTGVFAADDDTKLIYFSLNQSRTVALRTLSYAGGLNAAGTSIPEGGFDPTLAVFDANGNLIASNRDGGCGAVPADSVTGFCWDASLTLPLPAGNYSVVLTQSDNLPNGPTLSQSFVYDPRLCAGAQSCPTDAQGNFTAAPGSASPGFWDYSPSKRTGAWALDITGADSTTITAITSSNLLESGVVNFPYLFPFTAQSGAQATLRWSVVSGALPPGLTLNPVTGSLTGVPGSAGSYPFSVQVTDGFQPSLAQAITLVIYNPIVFTTSSLPAGVVGTAYAANIGVTGGAGGYVWTASGLPAGLRIDNAGNIGGTPTAPFNGSVAVTVTDAAGRFAAMLISMSVATPPLSISGSGNFGDVAVNAPVGAAFSGSGGIPPYTWTFSGISGLSVDSNGNVRGSSNQAGNFTGTLTVTDSLHTSSSISLGLAVLGMAGSFANGTTAGSYTGNVNGLGGLPPYKYTASGVPAGLAFSSGGVLSGAATTPGSYTIGVRVTDAGGVTVSQDFSFTITGPPPSRLTIVTSSLPDAFVGQPYTQALSASGGAPGYTWSQYGGPLPAGLTLSPGGTVSGTPFTPGSYSFGAQATDSSGALVTAAIALNVQPAPLQITNGTTFPNGIAGLDYPPQLLTASNGTPPYTFSTKGSLPAGLSLSNGQIGGTPTSVATSGFTLVVADSAQPQATASLPVNVTINPAGADLILSTATASFSFAAGTSTVPQAIAIPVTSSVVSQILSFSAAASASTPWLTVGGSATTPGSITIGLTTAALSLGAAGSPYAATITVTCTATVCAGKSQSIAVSLAVTSPPPQLSIDSPLLSFSALTSNPQPSSTALNIVNSGGGSLAIQSVTATDSWVTVGPAPSAILPGAGASITVTANPAGLKAGYYLSSITVATPVGSASVPVALLLANRGIMTLGPSGQQFSMTQGGALGNSAGSFLVSVSSGSVSFDASVLPGATWLTGGGSGTASAANPATVPFSIDPNAIATLPVGAYYGTIRVSTSGAVNSPQDFQVVLNIAAPATRIVPDPEPAGLLYLSSGGALQPQTIQMFASSKTAIGFQAAASPIDGSGWLAVSPATGFTSASSPAQISVSVNPAGLARGVYRGAVSFAFAAAAVRTVNVTLIVESVNSGPANTGATSKAISSCNGAQLVPTQTGLLSNFQSPASWPTPLQIQLVDTCGTAIPNAQLVTTFSNGDPPLVLSLVDATSGIYSGTWTPRRTASQLRVTATASAPGYTPATTQVTGQVVPNTAPVLVSNGTLDVFHPQVGGGLGPGNIVQIYGAGLASGAASSAVLPLPTELNGTSVLIGGVRAPLFYISPGQVNAQIPFELTAGGQYQVIVSANGALTTPQPIQLTAAVPSILQFNSGAVVAQHQDGTLIQDASPAAPGEYVTIYLSGLGDTDVVVPTGTPSPSSPLAHVVITPVLALNSNQVPVLFAGLTPGLVGLYQINFQIPQPLADDNYELVISQSGVVSNTTIIPVKNPSQN